MASKAKIAANQRNAVLSTGPISEKGKGVSKLNALKGGIYAKTRILPFEDPNLYEEISGQVYDEMCPIGFFEETLTEEIINDCFLLSRLERCNHAYFLSRAEFFARDRVVKKKEFSESGDIFGFLESSQDQRMHKAKGTKITREDMEAALANSVGMSEGAVCERIERRRRALVKGIFQKYEKLQEMCEKRLKAAEKPKAMTLVK